MKSIKMALMAGAALAVSAAAAQADDLEALKAQIESLNARVAAMEAAPSVPAGYSLLAISEGERVITPGLGMTAREMAGYGDKATYISVLPTADAPAGATITWSGYVDAGLVYSNEERQISADSYTYRDGRWNEDNSINANNNGDDNDDIDVKTRAQLRVTASTDTAVGEVGVDIRLRGLFNGNGSADVYSDVAWGYWAMTPEMTFGGGYADTLGKIGYGYDGSCTCYWTDNADVGFDPGKTTQMRLTYASGPFSMAIALEDASIRGDGSDITGADTLNVDRLGAAGEIKYTGDTFSGEISGVWRDVQDYNDTLLIGANTYDVEYDLDALWQVGAGVGFGLGDMFSLNLAAAMGGGPATSVYEGEIVDGLPYNQTWWGVNALASVNLTDAVHAEIAGGYKNREGDDIEFDDGSGAIFSSDGIDYDTWALMGGLYYDPVEQLTIGVEAEWYTTSSSITAYEDINRNGNVDVGDRKYEVDLDSDNLVVDLVSVWRF